MKSALKEELTRFKVNGYLYILYKNVIQGGGELTRYSLARLNVSSEEETIAFIFTALVRHKRKKQRKCCVDRVFNHFDPLDEIAFDEAKEYIEKLEKDSGN